VRPQIPVLAVLAVLAIPPSVALGQDATPAAVPSAATTTEAAPPAAPATTTDAAPAPTTTADAPAAPAPTAPAPPASTTTEPVVPAPTPGPSATPPPAFEPDLTDPDGPKLSTARPGGRETAKERRARERRERREAKARKDGKDRKGGKAAKDEDDEAKKDDDARTPADILAAPATGLSALSVARFRIPPFLLPIYQAAGMQYGIRWEILAAINEIETDYGRNLNVSSAGAQGWMQFMPPTWASYGVDANGDGEKDPYNPVDAIFAAARYLKAAGGMSDVRRAVFAYNHADWYVNDVLKRARAIASLPADVVSSLTGLTLAQLPVYVPEDEAAKAEAKRDAATEKDAATDAAKTDATEKDAATEKNGAGTDATEKDATKTEVTKTAGAKSDGAKAGTRTARADRTKADAVVVRRGGSSTWAPVSAPEDAAVVAVQDGTITRIGEGKRLGRFVEIRDAYGNSYTYAGLGTLAEKHLVPRKRAEKDDEHDHEDEDEEHAGEERAHEGEDAATPDVTAGTPGAEEKTPTADPVPTTPATAGDQPRRAAPGKAADASPAPATAGRPAASLGPSRPRTAAENAAGNAGRGSGTADDRGLGTPAAPAAPVFPGLPAPSAPGTTPAPGTTRPLPGTTTPLPGTTVPGTTAPDAASVPGATPAPAGPAASGGTPAPGTTTPGTAPAPGDATAAVPPTTTDGGPASGTGAVPPATTDVTPPFPALVPGLPGAVAASPPAEPTTITPLPGPLGSATRFSTVPLWQILAPEMPPVPAPEPSAPATAAEPKAEPEEEQVDRISTYLVRAGDLRRSDVRLRTLKVGSRVMAGTVLGRMGDADMRFAIRPAGEGAPRIDPRPIVAGWRLLDDASVFGHDDRSELVAERADEPDVGRLLLLSKERLQARVLADPKLQIYEAGRSDIRAGQIDRRVLATMEFLTANGLRLTITSLKSGHSVLSASGNVSAHSYGAAMDIAAVNGVTITPGTQGAGSITASTIRMLLRLQGTARPNQIISLMTFPGADNTMAMGDHDDHIHVGFPRDASSGDVKLGRQVSAILKPAQWEQLVGRLAEIDNPKVPTTPSKAARKAKRGER
jgi:hypothetical protein